MEIRTGKYTNFILTVIAALLLALLFQVSTGLVGQAQAQQDPRTYDYSQALVSAIQSAASGLNGMADAISDVAQSNQQISRSIDGLGNRVGTGLEDLSGATFVLRATR